MKTYWTLAALAVVVLGGASVWMGGLNQDEGWYLYAANLVAEGKMPYRDFFFTQGPVLPRFYSAFAWAWRGGGLLGARILTLAIGLVGIFFAALTARRMVPDDRKDAAALVVTLLLGCNLYHLYYLTIPKTYALASVFVAGGFGVLAGVPEEKAHARAGFLCAAIAGGLLAQAAGTRVSLGALPAAVGLLLLLLRRWRLLAGFCAGGFAGLSLAYLPFLCDADARAGLLAAQRYHAARGGFDPMWTVGSLSRLVRWYQPVFIVLGLGLAGRWSGRCRATRAADPLLWGFLAVFTLQMLAPFPYEDYQVPIMGLLAVFATVQFLSAAPSGRAWPVLLVLGLSFATSFGSPLLEKWTTNGQNMLWTLKKEKTELAQLRDVARRIEKLDPGGKTLLTQDLYLAVETGRKVPVGLEMGPFSMLDDAGWRRLLADAPRTCPVAALSGYTFAVEPPACLQRPAARQLAYWKLLTASYEPVFREEAFGQNATPLLVLKRK